MRSLSFSTGSGNVLIVNMQGFIDCHCHISAGDFDKVFKHIEVVYI